MLSRIGRFKVEAEIGEGAFGRVYRALDPKLGPIALKVLISERDTETLERFRMEAARTRSLTHKNIVNVYGFEVDDGVAFLQMELLLGSTLRATIDSNSLEGILEKVEVIREIGEGLSYAHKKGVIHCDLTPRNIMVLPTGPVKIMDFGIARALTEEAVSPRVREELADSIPSGTVPYMAPEQFDKQTTPLTDIFSFGVIAYELLSGIQPFAARDPRVVMHNIRALVPKPLSEVVASLPPALDVLVQRMMHKDPALRLQDVAEMLLDIQPILEELRKDRAERMSLGIESLRNSDDIEGLQRLVRGILDLHPNHVQGRTVWREIQAQAQANRVRERIKSLADDGVRHLAQRRFDDAISAFDAALKLDGLRDDVRSMREEATRLRESVRRSARLVAEARFDVLHDRTEAALEKVGLAIELDSENHEGAKLIAELREKTRLTKNAQVAKRILELIAKESFDDASAAIRELDTDVIEVIEWTDRVQAARMMMLARARATALSEKLEHIRTLRDGMQLEQAELYAQQVCLSFPESMEAGECLAEVQELLASHRRGEAIAAVYESANQLLTAGRLEEARSLLRKGLTQFGQDKSLSSLLERVQTLEISQKRELAVAEAVLKIKRKRDQGHLLVAVNALGHAIKDFGEEPSLTELRSQLETLQQERERAENLAKQSLESRRRQEEIDSLASQAWAVCEKGDVVRSLTLIEEAVRRYPNEPRLGQLLARITETKIRQDRAKMLLEGLKRARTLHGAKRWDEALVLIESLLKENGDSRDLHDLKVAAQNAREEHKQREAINRANRLMEGGAPDRAASLLRDLALQFPHNTEILTMLSEAEAARQRAEQESQIKECLDRAASKERNQDWEGALSLVRAIEGRYPTSKETKAAVKRIESELQKSLRNDQLNAELVQIQREITHASWRAAAARIDEAKKRFPEEQKLAELYERVRFERREQQLSTTIASARNLVSARDFGAAIKLLREALEQHVGEPRIGELLHSAEQDQLFQVELARAETLLSEQRFDEAEQLVTHVVAAYPNAAEPKSLLLRINSERDAAARKKKYEDGRAKAKQLSASFEFETAVEVLQGLLIEFPNDIVLERDLEAARRAVQEEKDQAIIDLEVRRLMDLRVRGEVDPVLEGVTGLLAKHEDARARELLQWANRQKSEIQRIRKETRRGKLIAACVALTVTLSVLAYLLLHRHHDLNSIHVAYTEVAFQPPAGDGTRLSKQLDVTADAIGARFVARATTVDNWLSVEPESGKFPATLTLSAIPAGLKPGKYTGIISVTSPNIPSATIPVSLEVAALPTLELPLPTPLPPPPPKPAAHIDLFTADPTSIERGQFSTLRWSVANSTDVSIDQGIGSANANGTRPVSPMATTKYTLTARGVGGSDTRDTTVNVSAPTPPPPPPPSVKCPPPPLPADSRKYITPVGDMTWRGQLANNGRLVLWLRPPTICEGGGQFLPNFSSPPGVDIRITVKPPTVLLTQLPTSQDVFSALTLSNQTGGVVNTIEIHWERK